MTEGNTRTISPEKLAAILADQPLWLASDGKNGQYAVLHGLDLSGTSISTAAIVEANGIVVLPARDPMGRRAVSTVRNGQRMVYAGDCAFTIDEARAHWGDAAAFLCAIHWLDAQPDDIYGNPLLRRGAIAFFDGECP